MIEKRLSRAILDINTLISASIYPQSVPGLAVQKALRLTAVLRSEATWRELTAVISRDKFNRYKPGALRQEYVQSIFNLTKAIDVTSVVRRCRDPRDDKFLELAVDGQADFLITGDLDLLTLNPFHHTTILTPADFLAR